VQDASSQASTIADSLGVTITGVIQATGTGIAGPQVVDGIGIQSSTTSSPSTTILSGTSTYSASVEIVYGIA
jgi:uncharacterized protein YggE